MRRRRKKGGRPPGTENVKRTYNVNFRLDMMVDYVALKLWKSKNEVATEAMRRGIYDIAYQEDLDLQQFEDENKPENLR